MNPLSCFRVPNENHGFEANLTCGYKSAIGVDCEGYNVVTVTKLALRLLLALLDYLLTTAKDLLSACICVQNDTQSCSHVNTMMVVVIIEILAS